MRKRKAPLNKRNKPEDPARGSSSNLLARDLDGFVHTSSGFLPADSYKRLRADNPAAGLPAYEDLGLLDG
jgi:hypothetical protein